MAKRTEQLSFDVEKLHVAEAKVQVIKDRIEKKQRKEKEALLQLHTQVGLASTHELIDALVKLVGRRPGRPLAGLAVSKEPSGRARRTVPTEAIRTGVIKAVRDGKTGAATAAQFGISLSLVNVIKREAGLSKKRTKK